MEPQAVLSLGSATPASPARLPRQRNGMGLYRGALLRCPRRQKRARWFRVGPSNCSISATCICIYIYLHTLYLLSVYCRLFSSPLPLFLFLFGFFEFVSLVGFVVFVVIVGFCSFGVFKMTGNTSAKYISFSIFGEQKFCLCSEAQSSRGMEALYKHTELPQHACNK